MKRFPIHECVIATSALWLLAISAPVSAQVDGDPFTGPEVEVCEPGIPMDPATLERRLRPGARALIEIIERSRGA